MRGMPWTRAALLCALTTLAGCASPDRETARGAPTGSSEAACLALAPIAPNRGKPGGVTIEDLAAVLDRDRPIERARNLLGDTAGTLRQVDGNNAALVALCK